MTNSRPLRFAVSTALAVGSLSATACAGGKRVNEAYEPEPSPVDGEQAGPVDGDSEPAADPDVLDGSGDPEPEPDAEDPDAPEPKPIVNTGPEPEPKPEPFRYTNTRKIEEPTPDSAVGESSAPG